MLDKKEVSQLKAFAAEIRIGILEQLRAKGVGHAGGSMSIADVLAVLYGKPIPVDLDKMLMKEIVLSNSYASERTSWQRLMNLLAAGKIQIEPYCSAVLELEDWENAFSMAENKEGYKILFQMSQE